MRFIFGFIFFGLLFYGLMLFFPAAFAVLSSWAAAFWDFFIGLFHSISGGSFTNRPATVNFGIMKI